MDGYIFPDMPSDWDGDIHSWENHCALVWCNNSLNAVAGNLKRVRFPDPKQLELAVELMERAQKVIAFFVAEREGLKEWAD